MRTPKPGVIAPWTESADTGLGLVYDFDGLAVADGTYVAVGTRFEQYWLYVDALKNGWTEDLLPTVWFSSDARTWQQADLPAEPELWHMISVVAFEQGFVVFAWNAVGPDEDTPTTYAFTSSDGREWQLAGSFAGHADQVGSVGGRLVVFGETEYDGPAAVWVSNDGATWQSVTEPSALDVAGGVVGLLSHDGDMWAVRSDDPSEDASVKTAVELWRTIDGAVWELVTELPRSISVTSAAMAVGPGGWVIAAGRSDPHAYRSFAWHSSDGVDWQRADSAPRVNDILADDAGFVGVAGYYEHGGCAIDEASIHGTFWASDDGRSWGQLRDKGWSGRVIEGLTRIGDTLIGIGVDWNLRKDALGVGTVWQADRSTIGGEPRTPPQTGGGQVGGC